MLNYRKLHHKHMFLVVALSLWVIVACQPEVVEVTRQNSGGTSTGGQGNPTPRPVPTDSVASGFGFGTFSMSNADNRRPTNIRQEAQFFAGGGVPYCGDREINPYIHYGADTYEIMTISTGWKAEDIHIGSCGWNSTGRLPVTVTYPNGTNKSSSTNVEESSDGGFEAYISLDLGSPPDAGTYRVTFQGSSGSVTHVFELIQPTEPRLYTLSNGDLFLWSFYPGERILVFAYENDTSSVYREAEFAAYQTFFADANGQLLVDVIGSYDAFVAYGELSGEVGDFDWLKRLDSILIP